MFGIFKKKTKKIIKDRTVDCADLMNNFKLFSIRNGIFDDSFEDSYARLISDINSSSNNDSFTSIIEKTQIFNDSYDLVKRHSHYECNDVESFLYMSNAYSQRACAFGSMLHGGILNEVADHYTGLSFKFSQQMTFHNKDFQSIAWIASFKLIEKTDGNINLDGLTNYLQCVIKNKGIINFPHKTHHFIEWEDILYFLDEISKLPKLSPETLNTFIYKNKKTNVNIRKEVFGDDKMDNLNSDDEYKIVIEVTKGVNDRINSTQVARQFVLEELDAARQGNEKAVQFVKNSGFNTSEYEGAMLNSFEDVDGTNGPQQFLINSLMPYASDMDLMVNLRLQVVENVIDEWCLLEQDDTDTKASSNNTGNYFWDWVKNNCNCVKFEPEEIEKWSDLKKLELRSNDLAELSGDISVLTGLLDLSLFHNNLSIVPKVIFNLTELTKLNLGVNQISELPRGIRQLKKLRILDLGLNQLISLPSEIGKLINLEQLIIHENNLTSIPKEIGNMTALKHISIWDNDLSSLPDEIMKLKNLETIELQNNNFSDENVKKWIDKFSNTKCKISFGYQQGNISEPIYIETNIKGGTPEDSFFAMYLNSKDGDMVSNIFRWSTSAPEENDPFSTMMANSKYNKIIVNEGLNAIDSESNIVPVNIELNAETSSTEDELIQWVKLAYIQTCKEHNLKPNSKLSIVSVGSSGKRKSLKMMEL